MLIPVVARSKAWGCVLSLARTAGSNPAGAWISVCFEFYIRVLCVGLITRPEESHRVWWV